MSEPARVLVADGRADVWGTPTAWSVSPESGFTPRTPGVAFRLTLDLQPSGDCTLESASDGFFSADDWFMTHAEGFAAAEANFGVGRENWRPGPAAPLDG